jgi:hypothetical protein
MAFFADINMLRLSSIEHPYIKMGSCIRGTKNIPPLAVTESTPDIRNINLYPNPARNQFFIGGLNRSAVVTVSDLIGRVVIASITVSSAEPIPVTALDPGIYLVHIETMEFSITKKLQITR